MFRPALKPLARIAITFAIVRFYLRLTIAYQDGLLQVAVVILLATPTWIVAGRALFPAGNAGGDLLLGAGFDESGRSDGSGQVGRSEGSRRI